MLHASLVSLNDSLDILASKLVSENLRHWDTYTTRHKSISGNDHSVRP